MSRLKVMTILGTRPEMIRLSRVISVLDQHCDHSIVHTGQNFDYELYEIFFKDLGLRKPDHFLDAAGTSTIETVANVLKAVDGLLEKETPDAVLVLGDTNSCLAVYAAKRRKIPIFHMEAGNRCGDERVPEEINRRIIDHISDVNMPYSERARDNLIAEGISKDRIIKTGSPMLEVLQHQRGQIAASDVMARLNLESRRFYVVSLHREENVDHIESFQRLINAINTLAERENRSIIFSCHPRTGKMLKKRNLTLHNNISVLKPLSFSDYLRLQTESIAVLSDSGTINEESSILNFPAINLRESHERMEAMEEGCVMLTGSNPDRIFSALAIVKTQKCGIDRTLTMPTDYNVTNVSEKVVRIVCSYVDQINRTVWRKK